MLAEKKVLGLAVGLVLAIVLIISLWVGSVQGSADQTIGVVNMEAVYTQHMAPPLFEARDLMQQEFDANAPDLSDEEQVELFEQYQLQLDQIEKDYQLKMSDAIRDVSEQQELDIVVDAAAILHGGIDITESVLDALK